jgi:hypothetical protein
MHQDFVGKIQFSWNRTKITQTRLKISHIYDTDFRKQGGLFSVKSDKNNTKSDKNNTNSPEDFAHLWHWLSHTRQAFLCEIWVEAEETVDDLKATTDKIIYARRAEVEETVDYQILLTLNLLT